MLKELDYDLLKLLIKQLKPEYQFPLIYKYYFDYSDKQIASTLHITPVNASVRLVRAKKKLLEMVKEPGHICPQCGQFWGIFGYPLMESKSEKKQLDRALGQNIATGKGFDRGSEPEREAEWRKLKNSQPILLRIRKTRLTVART